MLRHSPSRSKEEEEGCERDDDDHDDDDNDKKIKMGSASSLLLLLSSQQLPSSSMSKSPRTRTNIQQQQRRRRRQIVLLLSVCSCLILIIMMTSFSKNHHHHDVPQQSATTKNSLNLRSSSSSKSKPKVVLDREGNNINSPYYTDLDDTYHLETDPGEDYLLTHMNVSASINLEELIQGANEHEDKKVTLSTLVTIIGSGTAGLAAARQLQEEYGIYNYVIVEASSQSGGRVKKDTNFLDSGYPIDLGAAVVHRPDLIEDYANNRYQLQRNQQNNQRNSNQIERRQHFEYIRMPNGEVTFYNYSYYDWVMDYVAPQDHVTSTLYNCPVTSVTAYGNHVVTKCSTLQQQQQLSGSVVYNIESRYVIMTASLQVLRDNTIQFIPPLPDTYIPQTHNKAVMWKGAKIFIEFSTNFYMGQAFCLFHCPVNVHRDGELEDGESFYWDHGIPGYNIITGFVMGEAYKDLEDLSDKDRIQVFLTKMDELFDGQASKYYIKHIFMDWTNEKYVKGTYSSMGLEGPHMIHGGQIILAGEAFPVTEDGQGWVHGALLSGETAADYVASHWKHIVKDCGSYGGCKLTNGRQRKKNLKRTNVAIEPTKNGLVYYDTTIRRRRERETTT